MDYRITEEIRSCLSDLESLERELRNDQEIIKNSGKGIGLESVAQELDNMIMQYRKIANRIRSFY